MSVEKEYPAKLPDLGDEKERLDAVNDYFGEQYTDWSQITWSQLKWFLTTLMLHRELGLERDA